MNNKVDLSVADRWGIVYVPMAGVRKKHRRWHQIKQYLEVKKVHYDYIQSEEYGAVERLTRMYVENGYKTIVIVGGDMAINDAINGIMTSSVENLGEISFGIIANGIGNDFADFWGLDVDDYKGAIDCLIKGKRRRIDIGYCTYMDNEVVQKRYFLMAVNIGLGAKAIEISDECKRYWGKRNPTYIISLFRLFLRRKLYKIHLKVNDEIVNERLMTVCVGNSRGYGLTPSAVPYNGWLDVSIVYRPELRQMISGLWMLLRGRILNHKQVKPYRTKRVTIYDAEGASICVDGRTLEYNCPMEISLMPEFLNFIVPDK